MESRSYGILISPLLLIRLGAHEALHYLILVDNPAFVFLIPAFVTAVFLDDMIYGDVFQAGALS